MTKTQNSSNKDQQDNPTSVSSLHLIKTSSCRDLAKQGIFDYIEMFYNPDRKHANNDMLSPVEYEKGTLGN